MSQTQESLERAPLQPFDLTGKRVLVIGGKTGMGLGIARAAKAVGATVIVASRRRTTAAERPDLADFEQLVLDIRDEAAIKAAFETIGALDHLVITATPDLGSWGKFMDEDMGGIRSFMEGKFFGNWACARHAAPRLAPGGSITFLTGNIAVRPKIGFTAVSTGFAALEALSRSLAVELAPIRVNTLRPGYVDTDMWNFLPPEQQDGLRAKVRETFPARRAGTIGDIGHAGVFAMTNPYVTGSIIDVSGGEGLVDAL